MTNGELLGKIVQNGRRALAGYAATELLERCPQSRGDFPGDPFVAWQNWLAGRLEELAVALTAGRPALFDGQVRWAKALLSARGVSVEHFRVGLQCVREVLEKELPEATKSQALEFLDSALAGFDQPPADVASRLAADSTFGRLASAYLLAVLEGDRRRARQIVLGAVGDLSVPDIYLHVLLAAQGELGRMWVANEITIAEEHFATATTKIVMAQLLQVATCRPPNGKTFMAAAVAGNQHDVGVQAVADFFEIDGWRSIHLGTDMPASEIAQAVRMFRVDLLGLAASQSTQIPMLREAIAAARHAERGSQVKILVGGAALTHAERLPAELGADGYAADLAEAVIVGRRLIGLPEHMPADQP